MIDFFDFLNNFKTFEMFEMISWTVSIVAIGGVILNNYQKRACFVLWWVSNLATLGLHLYMGCVGLAVRDAAFFILAVHGFFAWRKSRESINETPGLSPREKESMNQWRKENPILADRFDRFQTLAQSVAQNVCKKEFERFKQITEKDQKN